MLKSTEMPLFMRTIAALLLASIPGPAFCAPPHARLLKPAGFVKQAPAVFRARFETTKGPFVIEVHRDWAPLGADRFYNLVRGGFYDGERFFRTVPKFVVQWGISPDPAVNEAWGETSRIQDDPVKQTNTRGFVTFAKGGPNTRTTQIYVNMADNSRLDKTGFAPFGSVVTGMDVFEKLYSEYGEIVPRGKGPDQKQLREQGEAYLVREFPLLDKIVRARIQRRQWFRRR